MKIAAVIPTYNESENIKVLIPKILDVFEKEAIDGEIMVVDDDSPDGTGRVAEELARTSGKLLVLRRSSKMGLGSAYKDGFRQALLRGRDAVIEMDADLSHDPISLVEFVRKLDEGFDLVIGSRYIPGGKIPKWSLYRRMISRLTNGTVRLFLGLRISDVTSGYRAFRAGALEKINFSSVKSDGYAFQVEMAARCQRAGLRLCEIPIAFVDRKSGESKLSRGEMWRFAKSLIRLTFMKTM